MSYKFSFADNATYSAADVNAITKRLVTSGIEDSFTDGTAYNVSKFNEAGKLLYTSGAVPESCLSLKVEKVNNGKILINPGKAFFDDGAVIEIETGGETLSYVSGSKNYVYLKNDLVNTNRCYPYCGTQAPEGDYVMLAEIDNNGAITDKRTYAQGKLPGYQSVAGNVMRIQERIAVTDKNQGIYIGSKTFDIGNNSFEYIMTYVKRSGGNPSDTTLPCLGIYDISDKSYSGFHCYNGDQLDSEQYVSYDAAYSGNSLYIRDYPSSSTYEVYLKFAIDNEKLTVTLNAYTQYGSKPSGFDIDLILF